MKKILFVTAVAVLAVACSGKSSQTKTTTDGKTVYYTTSAADADNAKNAKNAKYQIIDQEFDNMLAPDSDYDTLSDYELQACGSSYLPPAEKLKKSQAKTAAKAAAKAEAVKAASAKVSKNKKVVNNTNIYYIDGPAPAVPVHTSSSSTTTTTTYSSNEIAPDTLY